MTGFIIAGIAGAVVVGIILWCVSTANRFRRLDIKIAEADSGVDVALTQRFDTLTKALEVCRGYARHETELMTSLISLRQRMEIKKKEEAQRNMDEISHKIALMAEAYPELRSNENFRQLQKTINQVEDRLQAARRIYNMNVSMFNRLLASFPSSLIGRAQRKEPHEFFAAEERKKEDVEIKF